MTEPLERVIERNLDRRRFLYLLGSAGVSGALIACGDKKGGTSTGSSGSNDESESESAGPDFATVFPSDRVNQIKLSIGREDWQAMLTDMTALFGARGTGGGLGQGNAGGARQGGMPPGQMPGGGGAGGNMGLANTKKPMWVAGDVSFNGKTWSKVGIRFKGNSSLRSSWGTGSDRMPFKLDFDQWEDKFPEVEDQRFHGFKQLSLSNNVGDNVTNMRESLAYDVLEAAGLPAAHTAFYEVILDRGEGEASLGIYTVIEVVDDTMLKRVFGEDEGNIYEAEGSAASLAAGVAANLKNSFQKENNEDAADWSDIERFHSTLHSEKRTSDQAGWRRELEAVFDVPVFLEWLAVSAALQHWDTYGGMTHNYYLYNKDGKLTWISWDHNFILGAMGGGGNPNQNAAQPNAANNAGAMAGGGMGGRSNTSLDKKEVSGASWPLIRFLMDVPDYYAGYRRYLAETISGPFNAAAMQSKYERWAALLAPYAEKQGNGAAFQAAVQSLVQTTKTRNQAIGDFLAT